MPLKRQLWRRRPLLIPLLLLALVAAGCAGLRLKPPDDADQLAGNEWWNFYRRARARFDAGNIAGAREDFERCLGLRKGSGLPCNLTSQLFGARLQSRVLHGLLAHGLNLVKLLR